MKPIAARVGIAAGLIATPLLLFPVLKLFLGDCFFEQGCGKYEKIMLLGVVLGACGIGAGIGWAIAKLANLVVKH